MYIYKYIYIYIYIYMYIYKSKLEAILNFCNPLFSTALSLLRIC